jgi:hypothetical protein
VQQVGLVSNDRNVVLYMVFSSRDQIRPGFECAIELK